MPVRQFAGIVLIAGLLLTAGCLRSALATATPTAVSTVDPLPTSTPLEVASTPTALVPNACSYHDELPDPVCTPGALNPDVTQDTIGQTICVSGWTATIRPPSSYTTSLKRQQMHAYGDVDAQGILLSLTLFEEDHLVALELGGHPTDPRNLWPERGGSPNPKDSIEGELHRRVCSGRMLLAEAQQRIATDWTHALDQ